MLPHLLPALAADSARAELEAAGSALSPVPRGGFEVRLAAGSNVVDLHQCVTAANGEPMVVAEHLARVRDRVHPGWDRIAAFCRSWTQAASAAHRSVQDLWIECDLRGTTVLRAAPSVFLGFAPKRQGAEAAWAEARDSLEILLGAATDERAAASVARCFDACEGDERVSHVGAMSARPAQFRLNIKQLSADRIQAYLCRAGWLGSERDVLDAVDLMFPLADRVALCLDVGAQVEPTLGLECSCAAGAGTDSMWRTLFDRLAVRGWCAPEKASAALAWPGTTTPMTDSRGWPVGLIAESLIRPVQDFSVFRRQLSHVKLAHRTGREPEAKAYLWFGHEWVDGAGRPRGPSLPDLDTFYSEVDIALWKRVIGGDLHYHLGHFLGEEDIETGARQAVRLFYEAIPAGASVLDAGCGWGGPARMLEQERGCAVDAVTISRAQAKYCRGLGLKAEWGDLERDELSGRYDVAFMLESLEHIHDKAGLLRRLRACAGRLVLEVNCLADGLEATTRSPQFGGSMPMCTVSELRALVEGAGWRVRRFSNRRPHTMRSIVLWREALDCVFGASTAPGQLGVLRDYVGRVLEAPGGWARDNPLIDIVAE